MPIKIPDGSPAETVLRSEGVELIPEGVALRQDIRPLRILLLNLMPTKIATEVQIARLLSHTPLQVELSLLTTASYTPRNTPIEHLQAFYRTLDEVRSERYDAMIITGAPVETLAYNDVAYWPEFMDIFEWSKTNVFRRFSICWGALAALYAGYGVDKEHFSCKLSGVFPQTVRAPEVPVLRGFPEAFPAPVSRWSGVRHEDLKEHPSLRILADSPASGTCLVQDESNGDLFMFNHLEYDTDTLKGEYFRDLAADPAAPVPYGYFPDDDPQRDPVNQWKPFAHMLFWNWITCLYRDTPYDLNELSGQDI